MVIKKFSILGSYFMIKEKNKQCLLYSFDKFFVKHMQYKVTYGMRNLLFLYNLRKMGKGNNINKPGNQCICKKNSFKFRSIVYYKNLLKLSQDATKYRRVRCSSIILYGSSAFLCSSEKILRNAVKVMKRVRHEQINVSVHHYLKRRQFLVSSKNYASIQTVKRSGNCRYFGLTTTV